MGLNALSDFYIKLRERGHRFRLDWSSIRHENNNKLAESRFASAGWLLGAAAWLFIGQGVYLLSIIAGQPWLSHGNIAIVICTAPLLVIGLFDFRAALLISIISTPLFSAPPVPHLFTQGLGDLFALTAVSAFLIKHARQGLQLVHGKPVVLILVPIATLASIIFNFQGLDVFKWNDIKYEIAELAGLSLAVIYSLLLASTLQCEKDLKVLITALFIAVTISAVHGLVSLTMVSACMPGLEGTIMSPGGQVSGGFGNPNYYGSWLLVVLPLCLYRLSDQKDSSRRSLRRLTLAIAVFLIIFLLLLTVSRAALLALVFVLLVWGGMAKKWLTKSKALVIILTVVIFFPAVWNFRFEACRRAGDFSLYSYIINTNSLQFLHSESLGNFASGKTTVPLEVQKDEHGNEHPSRKLLLIFAYEAWQSAPWFGVGPGNLSNIVRDRTGIGERSHNVATTILAEQGLVGLLAWAALWITLLRKLWCPVWGHDGAPSHRSASREYLFLAFLALTTTSLFADQFRVIWLWQFIGMVFSPYFSNSKTS